MSVNPPPDLTNGGKWVVAAFVAALVLIFAAVVYGLITHIPYGALIFGAFVALTGAIRLLMTRQRRRSER